MPQTFEKPVRHNFLVFYLHTLLYMAMALLLRVIALIPLTCLFIFPPGSLLRCAAFLSPAFFVFLILPMRFSFAEAIAQKPIRFFFSFDIAFALKDYPQKLTASLRHAFSLFKWGIPLIGFLIYLYFSLPSATPLTIAASLNTLGQMAVAQYNRFVHLTGGILGNAEPVMMEGGFAEGILTLLGNIGIFTLVWLYGAMRNSAYRYIWAIGRHDGRKPHAEIRFCLRKKRFLQLLYAIANAILWFPFLLLLARTAKTIAGDLAYIANLNLMDGLSLLTGSGLNELLIGQLQNLFPLLFALFALYFPLLPVRRTLTASFSAGCTQTPTSFRHSGQAEHTENSFLTSTTEATPAPAYVPHANGVFTCASNAHSTRVPTPATQKSSAPAFAQTANPPKTGFPFDPPEKKLEPRNDIDSSAFTIGQ